MSGPQNVSPRPLAMGALEAFEKNSRGWDDLMGALLPAVVPENFDPGDQVKRFAAAMVQTAEGRAFVDWLLDITCRAPYPVTTQAIEDLAMAAAKHQARAAIGETIAAAIADGKKLLNP